MHFDSCLMCEFTPTCTCFPFLRRTKDTNIARLLVKYLPGRFKDLPSRGSLTPNMHKMQDASYKRSSSKSLNCGLIPTRRTQSFQTHTSSQMSPAARRVARSIRKQSLLVHTNLPACHDRLEKTRGIGIGDQTRMGKARTSNVGCICWIRQVVMFRATFWCLSSSNSRIKSSSLDFGEPQPS